MSYEVNNPIILRLQMRLMLWVMGPYHRTNDWLIDADYFSRCDADLCYDPLVMEYLNKTIKLCKLYPPVSGAMLPHQNMPCFRGPRIQAQLPADAVPTFLAIAESQSGNTAITTALAGVFINDAKGCHTAYTLCPCLRHD